jgi:hypothetical protein
MEENVENQQEKSDNQKPQDYRLNENDVGIVFTSSCL